MRHSLTYIITISYLILLGACTTRAQELRTLDREWQPIVLPCYSIPEIDSVQVENIHLYAYNATSDTWSKMPFQIDEKTFGPNPLNESDTIWVYFPEMWASDSTLPTQHDGLFHDHDELVFMARDLGDKAPNNKWIDDIEARTNPRLELIITDPLNTNQKAYAYVYQLSSTQENPPSPYEIFYDADQDRIDTKYYAVRIDEDLGVIKDIEIKSPFGDGEDIFDSQKFRFYGILDVFGFQIDAYLDETFLHIPAEADVYVTQNPVVRLIRIVEQGLDLQGIEIPGVHFWATAKFYPFNGTIKGGGSLDAEIIKQLYPESEFGVILKNLRQSWDFNDHASGMQFYNKYNQNITVDGLPDVINKQVDTMPVSEWSLTSGDQGSFFTYAKFAEPNWSSAEFYYYDNKNGGQADQAIFIETGDTGDDNVSYGDTGILFESLGLQVVTLDLEFTGYFLEKNKDKAFGEQIASWIENPLTIQKTIISDIENIAPSSGVLDFSLSQNYPNPFNNATVFSFSLPEISDITLKIYDINGRLITTILNEKYNRGFYKISWDGLSERGESLPSGVYVYTLTANEYTLSKKLLILR